MSLKLVVAAGVTLIAPVCALGVDVDAVGAGYHAVSYFTSKLKDGVPGDKIERAHLELENIVLFTEWTQLEDRPHRKEVRVYDPYDALVHTWHYEFTPINGNYNTWFRWCLCEDRDAPGKWRFEALLDEKPAFVNSIVVERQK